MFVLDMILFHTGVNPGDNKSGGTEHILVFHFWLEGFCYIAQLIVLWRIFIWYMESS